MTKNSFFFFQIQDKPNNSDHYSHFLTQLFVHLTDNYITGAHLIMDNVIFHKTEEVRNIITAHRHNPVYLPPYSPFLNAIEELFSEWKRSIRAQEAKTEEQLYDVIDS